MLVAEAIPYRNLKEMINIVKQELIKIDIWKSRTSIYIQRGNQS